VCDECASLEAPEQVSFSFSRRLAVDLSTRLLRSRPTRRSRRTATDASTSRAWRLSRAAIGTSTRWGSSGLPNAQGRRLRHPTKATGPRRRSAGRSPPRSATPSSRERTSGAARSRPTYVWCPYRPMVWLGCLTGRFVHVGGTPAGPARRVGGTLSGATGGTTSEAGCAAAASGRRGMRRPERSWRDQLRRHADVGARAGTSTGLMY
jgi:hypothetical protein